MHGPLHSMCDQMLMLMATTLDIVYSRWNWHDGGVTKEQQNNSNHVNICWGSQNELINQSIYLMLWDQQCPN